MPAATIAVTIKAMEGSSVSVHNYKKGRTGNNIRQVWEEGTVLQVDVHIYRDGRTWTSYRVRTQEGRFLYVTDDQIKLLD